MAALVYIFGVLGVTLYTSLHTRSPETPPSPDLSKLTDLTGTVTYALEGICLVLPVEASMAEPAEATRVVMGSLVLYSILVGGYSAVAVSAGLGECGVVTECLTGVSGDVVKVALR